MGIPATSEQIAEWVRKGLIEPDQAPGTTTPEPATGGPLGRPKPASPRASQTTKASRTTKTRPVATCRVQIVVWIPGLTVRSEPNLGGRLRGKIARKVAIKEAVRGALSTCFPPFALPPVRVVMTRVGTRKLDDDNLETAFKAVRDTIADWLGVDDGDTQAVRFRCKQRPGYQPGIEIRIG